MQYPSTNIFIDIAYLTAKIACLYKYTFVKRVNTYEKYLFLNETVCHQDQRCGAVTFYRGRYFQSCSGGSFKNIWKKRFFLILGRSRSPTKSNGSTSLPKSKLELPHLPDMLRIHNHLYLGLGYLYNQASNNEQCGE